MNHFDFFPMQRDMETKKQTKYFDVKCDNSEGMQKMIKKWEGPSFQKTISLAFMNFMITNIEIFAGINVVVAVTETLYFFTSCFILQIVNILVLLFRNFCVLDKLQHCFLNLKGHLKLIKNYNHC